MSNSKFLKSYWGALISIGCVTIGILVIRYLGWLQPWEWAAYDLLFRVRPTQSVEERIVLVTISEHDIQQFKQYPFSDEILAELIRKIKQQQPAVIGLDIFRDIPIEPGHEELIEVFQSTPNLFGVKKEMGDLFYGKIAPPPILEELEQVATSDIVVDGDGVVRRMFLYTTPGESLSSLGLAVALEYLKRKGIEARASAKGWLQLAQVEFYPFSHHDGGYVRVDDGGYQLLVNYRGPGRNFTSVSVEKVLSQQLPPDLMRGRIVLIGATAESLNDFFNTPYSKELSDSPILMSGVELHGNLASHVLSAVLDKRPLIRVWSEPIEIAWLCWWIVIPGMWLWQWRREKPMVYLVGGFIVSEVISLVLILGSSYLGFIWGGWWIPVVPPLLGMGAVSVMILFCLYLDKLLWSKEELEFLVEERKQELEIALQKLLAQEKLASLGSLTAGVAHDLRNPLNAIRGFVESSIRLTNLLMDDSPEPEKLKYWLNYIKINNEDIRLQVQRGDKLIQQMLLYTYSDEQQQPEFVELNQLVEMSLKLVLSSSQLKGEITVEKDYSLELETALVVGQDIQQVLINILDNSLYAMGQRKRQTPTYQGKLWIKTQQTEWLIVQIRDNGGGIPSEIQERIFEPFFTTKLSGEGIGLGLYLARDLLSKNGGNLTIVSQAQQTQATLFLPIRRKYGQK